MQAKEVRRRYLDFFKKREHAEIAGASLVPENDPTVLFTTAGMHPLVPYLLGEKHPAGKRLVNYQKCLRTDDIDEVGDDTHLTFFEMLGNWSLGDYFKEEAIKMSYSLLTTPIAEGGYGISPDRLCVSCFAGDRDAPKDDEAAAVWQNLGFKLWDGHDTDHEGKIFFFGKKENWWGPAGQTGPCGPDSEMFYIRKEKAKCSDCDQKGPSCSCGRYVEIWNDVFMQYEKQADGLFKPLSQQNVDTGLGLERVTALLQGRETVFETELFASIINTVRGMVTKEENIASLRVIADHLRAAIFILADRVTPANTDQGYVLRRLIRRAIRNGWKLGIEVNFCAAAATSLIADYAYLYPELKVREEFILAEMTREEEKFKKTLVQGEKELERILPNLLKNNQKILSGRLAFRLYDTYGFPLEMTRELAAENGLKVDEEGYSEAFAKHQELSRAGAEQKFKGGLADDGESTTALHTATHLLHQALRTVLGHHVEQRGSNITKERLRFDFSHPEAMTEAERTQVEALVNEQIQLNLPVEQEEMTVAEAKKGGAIGLFEEKYGEKVKVYGIGDFSKEICGGPHVKNTGQLGRFRLVKEQSCGAGLRRIKAVLETAN